MKIFTFSLFFFFTATSFSQNFVPIDTADTKERTDFLNLYQETNAVFAKQLSKKYKGRAGRELSEMYESFYTEFSKEIERGSFIYDERFSGFAEEILTEITTKNPGISKELRLLISRDITANAYCLADGTMVLHLGLFHLLENEEQLAAILAHELAHKILEHSIKMNHRNIEESLSGSSRKKMNEIKRTKYNQTGKAMALFKETMYENGKNRRLNELESDSLALVLLKNTKYSVGAYVKALQLIKQHDSISPMGLQDSIYRQVFNLPELPFDEKWFEAEDFSKYNYDLYEEKLNLDSIASHPETVERIQKAALLNPEAIENYAQKEPSEKFKELSKIAAYERVPSLYATEAYGLGIYLSLLELQLKTDDPFYKKWLGNCFQKVYEARKNYTLNRYLERVNPQEQSKSYQKFLSFMWNLDLDEIKHIADYYRAQ